MTDEIFLVAPTFVHFVPATLGTATATVWDFCSSKIESLMVLGEFTVGRIAVNADAATITP